MDGILDWYWLGVALGLGIAVGIPLPYTTRPLLLTNVAVALAVLAAVVIGVLGTVWAFAAAAGGLVLGAAFLRRLSAAARPVAVLAVAGLAFVPAVGYLEALAAPVLGARLRRRLGARYAGLRVLAKD